VATQATALRERVRELVKDEAEEIKIWARVQLGRERRVAVAREFGYRDGSGVTHLLKVIAQNAAQDASQHRRLLRIKQAISSFKS